MTAVAPYAVAVDSWRLRGQARIDERPPVHCTLTVRADGTWSAELAIFTLAGAVDLFLVTAEGGHFCGPASVARSRADTDPFATWTDLEGTGPLLVVAPGAVQPELAGGTEVEMLDGEVVE